MKTNKRPGYDDINFNVAKKWFGEINEHLKHSFNLSLENEIFPEKMKIAKVIPLFKNDDLENLTNYRPIYVLPCFSKALEHIMSNQLYEYFFVKKNYYTQSSLDPKKVILKTMLLPISLIKCTSLLNMITTRSEYS